MKQLTTFQGPNKLPVVCKKTGNCPHRVILLTVPKSGSWMFISMLQQMDVVFAGLDVNHFRVIDHRGLTPEEQKKHNALRWRDRKCRVSIEQAAKLIQPGQFVVSHSPPRQPMVSATHDWKRIFVCRELRHKVISTMRYGNFQPDNKNGQERLSNYLRGTKLDFSSVRGKAGWLKHPNVLCVHFEDVVGGGDKQRQTIDQIGNHLDVQPNHENVRSQIGTKNMTYTGKLSTLDEFWSEEAEEWFRSINGPQLNQQLGYDE